jgi:hypothetical protein
MDAVTWTIIEPSVVQQYLRVTEEVRFLYCRRGVEREFFSFFFWAI